MRVLKRFPYSVDGVVAHQAVPGADPSPAIPARLLPGLAAAGYIAMATARSAPENTAHPAAPETAEAGRRPRRARPAAPPAD